MSSPLRKRFHEDLQLAGLAEKTQEAYVGAVFQLAKHFRRSPDAISGEELRDYFLYLRNEKQASRSTTTIALCAIRFLVVKTLRQPWTTLQFVRPPASKKLPAILSCEEVQRLLAGVVLARFRVCLLVIYSCGLRLGEGVHLRVRDVDSPRGLLFQGTCSCLRQPDLHRVPGASAFARALKWGTSTESRPHLRSLLTPEGPDAPTARQPAGVSDNGGRTHAAKPNPACSGLPSGPRARLLCS